MVTRQSRERTELLVGTKKLHALGNEGVLQFLRLLNQTVLLKDSLSLADPSLSLVLRELSENLLLKFLGLGLQPLRSMFTIRTSGI